MPDDLARTRNYRPVTFALAAGLIVAIAAIGLLWKHLNDTNAKLAEVQDATQSQISKLSDATTSLLEQRLASLDDKISSAMKDSQTNFSSALKQAKTQASKQSDELRGKLDDERDQITGQLAQLKDAADSKFQDVSTNMDAVKSDVTGVKSGVATAQENLDKTNADLKRVIGDMGTMSGLIATNAKDLSALRALGERNYIEFDLSKQNSQQKVGDVTIALKKTDPKRNRYTVEILADDKNVQKSDKTINEPVQFYLSRSKQPYELVVNQVKKDEVVGYISEPKVLVARQ